MLKDGCPQAIKNCSGYFSKLIDPQVRNTLLTDIACFLSLDEEVDEPADIIGRRMTAIAEGPYKALQIYFSNTTGIPREAQVLNYYTINKLTFSTFTRHRGNSFILVRRPSLSSVPAQIETILQVSSGDIYFVVRFFHKTMSEDPFEKYPDLQSSLWSQDLGQLVIIKPQDIESHFAGLFFTWYGAGCLAVVSLSRVSLQFFHILNQHLLYFTGILIIIFSTFFLATLYLPFIFFYKLFILLIVLSNLHGLSFAFIIASAQLCIAYVLSLIIFLRHQCYAPSMLIYRISHPLTHYATTYSYY